jgi:precorrin-2 dehydrogenase/sirohydrochlorin ferrochelatase
MAFGYPISLELADRNAVVIGTGAVAQGKVEALVEAGARVTVVASGPPKRLDRLVGEERVTVFRRAYEPGDLEGAFLCVASSDEPETRAAIYREGHQHGVLVNVMDDPPHCDFAAPAVVRRGDLIIAVSTAGRSPALARRLRIDLEERFGPEWAEVLDVLERARHLTLPALPDLGERSRRWERALDLDEVRDLVRAGRPDEARDRLVGRLLQEGAA